MGCPRQLGVSFFRELRLPRLHVAMGRLLTDYGFARRIIECTQGGTSLAVDWAAGGAVHAVPRHV